MKLHDRLQTGAGPKSDSPEAWRPELFDLAVPGDAATLESLFEKGAIRFVHDTIRDQLAELAASREPGRRLGLAERESRPEAVLDGRPAQEYGRWVYYPWSARLVHLLPAAEFLELRTDRNRYKILPAEQAKLAVCTIGVVGLSVGLSAVLTMASEGVGGRFRLADFDALGLSNLNRLRAGVHDLGGNKAILAARLLFELNPYLVIEAFPKGVDDDNLEKFMAGGGKLDLLVEECDDLFMKVRIREEARRLGIPVVMETSDRGLLDVERFDLEPDRKPFHGLLGEMSAASLQGLPTRDKIPFALRILDANRLSPSLAASLVEVERTISTWPQLGSAVTLGGALVTTAARLILLGKLTRSGRAYVDVDQLLGDGLAEVADVHEPLESPGGAEPLPLPARPTATQGPPTPDELSFLVAHATLAPSGGNSQPWRFEWTGGELLCRYEGKPSFLDFGHRAAHLAVGAAVENILLATEALGLDPTLKLATDPGSLVCSLAFAGRRRPGHTSPLLAQIGHRLTNRRLGNGEPLTGCHQAALEAAAEDRGGRLQLLTDSHAREAAGEVLGLGDRFRTLTMAAHAEMVAELRWTGRETRETRDGIDLATLEISAADRAALRLIARPEVAAELNRLGGGMALAQPAREAAAGAAAVGLLTFAKGQPGGFFSAGRTLQHLWLTATGLGISLRPWSVLPYLFARLEQGGDGFSPAQSQELAGLRSRYYALFQVHPGESQALVFLLSYAPPATARSLRRSVDEVLIVR
jgi:molybdopterin/thiamine biosynthesis adenylyltransferase